MANTKRILIADDDEDLLQAMTQRCCQAGFHVETARDGMSALRMLSDVEPDLVILDVNMPSGSGLSVCEMAAQEEWLQSIPVVVLTGRTDLETIRRCRHLQAHYVLKCPDVWQRLEPLLGKLLGVNRGEAGDAPDPPIDGRSRLCRAEAEHPRSLRRHWKAPSPSHDREEPSSQAPVEPASVQDRYFDAIFSALGWGEAPEIAAASDDAPGPARPCVLCIDDDADFVNSIRMRLGQRGIDVDQAFAGMAGYRHAFTSMAQAIILDFQMPDGNGTYILRRLKENPATCDIPVIVLTGRQDRSLERTMYNLGATQFLTKPVEWDRLLSALERFMPLLPQPTAP